MAQITGKKRAAVLAADNHACARCGATARLTVDHRIPVLFGGSDDPSNLWTLCLACNSKKSASLDEKWLRRPTVEELTEEQTLMAAVRAAAEGKRLAAETYRNALQAARDAGHPASTISVAAGVTRQAVLLLTVAPEKPTATA